MTDLARLPQDGGAILESLAERHRAALRAACAEDLAIWPIYSVSFDPEHFDAAFDRLLADCTRVGFAVFDGGALAGMSAYISPDPVRGVVEVGNTYLRPAVRGTGLNGRLKRLMLDHAFTCGFRRVEFRIDIRNTRSQAAIARLGGVREGVMRAERVTWTGHVRDTALFSILSDEWQAAG